MSTATPKAPLAQASFSPVGSGDSGCTAAGDELTMRQAATEERSRSSAATSFAPVTGVRPVTLAPRAAVD
jgi:hypothetical protein